MEWARDEFGTATLNDVRNVERLVKIAAAVADNGAPVVAAVFDEFKELCAAYDFVENPRVRPEWITRASARGTVARCAGEPFVFVPVDGTSHTLRDPARRRGLGPISRRVEGARGVHAMSAIAVTAAGLPAGLVAMDTWVREERATTRKGRPDRRPVEARESGRWLTVCEEVRQAFAGTDVKPWFQMDRGADAWAVLLDAAAETARGTEWTTIRASADRRALLGHEAEAAGEGGRLFSMLDATPVLGHTQVELRDTPTRQGGWAKLEVRVAALTLQLTMQPDGRHAHAEVWGVRVREVETCPDDEAPLEWTLLTTRPVRTLADAELVLRGYTMRWRVEDFHKHWKQGGLDAEQMQLGSLDGIGRWMRILAAVAMRTLRLSHLARVTPTAPASEELSTFEVLAARLKKASAGKPIGAVPSALEMLWVLAEAGGHTHGTRKMPGPKVLARGLQRMALRAQGIRDAVEAGLLNLETLEQGLLHPENLRAK